MNFSSLIQKLSQRQSLLAPEMEFSMGEILSEKLSENDVITFLTLLRDKGETSEEIFGAVNVLRKKMTSFPLTSAKGALRGRLNPALPVEGATQAPIIGRLTQR